VYTPETSGMKGTSGYIKNMKIKQPCNHKVGDFATAFRVRKHFGTFEKQAPEVEKIVAHSLDLLVLGLFIGGTLQRSKLEQDDQETLTMQN